MVICRFFLQGNCRYGENCRFEHQINNEHNYGNNTLSIVRKPNTIDSNVIHRSILTDMTNALNGNQWLLSCYTPIKDKPLFPGLDDQSFEEVRYGYLEALKTGTIEQYKQSFKQYVERIVYLMKSLENPTNELLEFINQTYGTAPNPPAFGAQPPTNDGLFAKAAKNLFGNAQTIFANTAQPTNPNIFANTPNPPIFASTPFQPQPYVYQTTTNHEPPTPTVNQPLFVNEKIDITLYSKKEDLNQNELNWYENSIDIMSIPENPPTYEMCFK